MQLSLTRHEDPEHQTRTAIDPLHDERPADVSVRRSILRAEHVKHANPPLSESKTVHLDPGRRGLAASRRIREPGPESHDRGVCLAVIACGTMRESQASSQLEVLRTLHECLPEQPNGLVRQSVLQGLRSASHQVASEPLVGCGVQCHGRRRSTVDHAQWREA